jgi:hypothetical protein
MVIEDQRVMNTFERSVCVPSQNLYTFSATYPMCDLPREGLVVHKEDVHFLCVVEQEFFEAIW